MLRISFAEREECHDCRYATTYYNQLVLVTKRSLIYRHHTPLIEWPAMGETYYTLATTITSLT